MRKAPIPEKKRHRFESHLGWNQNWWTYYVQYKVAVDKLVGLIELNTGIDTVVMPLLFLIRHSLELGYKANILKLENINSKVLKIKLQGSQSHSLERLNNKFKEHLEVILFEKKISSKTEEEIEDYLKKFEPLKNLLHNLDRGSFSFRYPVDTNGIPNFEWNDKIQVADIINMFNEIHPFLMWTENVLVEEGAIEPEQ